MLAFRGTQLDNFWQHVLDVRTDLKALPVRDASGDFIHRGFLEAVDEVWLRVRRHVAEQQRLRSRPLWITGHSLGAGLATIAARRCSNDPALGAVGLYAYASPPVGDAQFSRRVSVPAFRVANNADVLTTLPSVVYAPVGELRFIDENGQVHRQPPSAVARAATFAENVSGSLLMSASRLRLARLGVPLPGFIADHAPINYATLLWNSYIEKPSA